MTESNENHDLPHDRRTTDTLRQEFILDTRQRLDDLCSKVEKILDWQHQYGDTMRVLDRIASTGIVIRWLFYGSVALLAAIGAFGSAVEAFKKWVH